MANYDELANILKDRTCANCDFFRIGDACGGADGYCLRDVDEGPLEYYEVNDADHETCPRFEPADFSWD